jgi:hypothetical protein
VNQNATPVRTIETQAVAGSAYRVNDDRGCLTHAVDIAAGTPLCGRVKPQHLLDDACAQDPNEAPTCHVCLSRDPRQGDR